MKGTQRERTVVQAAAQALCERLRQRSGVVVTHYWIECWVKSSVKRARGRADAIVAAIMEDGSIYTVSVEAKSMRTFRAIRGEGGCVAQFLLAGAVGAVFATAAWWRLGGAWAVVAAVAAFLIAAILTLWVLERFRLFFKRAAVIDQLAGYPGNERWLAIAQDALKKSTAAFEDLLIDCRAARFGVLGVRRHHAPIVHLEAVHGRETGDRLSDYVRGDTMRRELMALAHKQATPDVKR